VPQVERDMAPTMTSTARRVDVALLGRLDVTVAGRPLLVDTRKALAILAVLATEGAQRREHLTAMLWPTSDPRHAAGAFRRTLSVLNAALDDDVLLADRRDVRLVVSSADIDVARVAELVASTSTHGHPAAAICAECREPLESAAALHRGPFLDGFTVRGAPGFDDWQLEWGERLQREFCQVLDRLTRCDIAAGALDAAVAHTQVWLATDPLNEDAHARLMLLHARRGERSQAIQRYRDCVAVLDLELGVRPLERTTKLYRALLEGKLDRHDGATMPAMATSASEPVPPARPSRMDKQPLVGRDPELKHADEQTRHGMVLVVEGETGIGKTRFVEELEARLHRRDASILVGRCHPDDRSLSFAPVVELIRTGMTLSGALDRLANITGVWIAEAARLVPELGDPPAAPSRSDQSSAQLRLLDAVAHVLSAVLADRPTRVILLEDLHHADEATLELVAHLAHRLAQHRLALILTCRDHELGPLPLAQRLAGSGEERTVLRLGRLSEAAVAAYVRAILGDRDDLSALTARVWQEADGLPLAVVEYTRWLAEREPCPDTDWPIPSGVRELVRGRLAALSDAARQVATAIAVAGRDVHEDLVRRVAGRTVEETAEGLEELVEGGLLRSSDAGFDFAHDRIRTIVYEDTNAVRRRLLHARVAEAMAGRFRPGAHPAAIIAEHARLGGRVEDAAVWSVRAGDEARSVFANDEARQHYQQALALEPPDPASVHARLARLEVLDGNYVAALASYETAAAHAVSPLTFAAIEHELGALHLRRRGWATARAHLETALAAVDGQDGSLAARITADLGLLELTAGNPELAAPHTEAALRLAETARDHAAMAQARNVAGLLARRRGHITEAQRHLEHAAALAATVEDPSAYIAALNNLALTTSDAGDNDRAVQLLTTALRRCDQQGDRHRRAALLNNLADTHHRAGDPDRSRELLRLAVAQFAEVGEAPHQDPEIWQLTEW
jgi:predicted ATPase/DNA-binding SARP family transcriptional activator